MDPGSGDHHIHPAARTLVMGYHSDMSPSYLQSTYENFNSPEGACKILCATACAATVRTIETPSCVHIIIDTFRVSISTTSRSSSSMACVRTCALRYNVLDAVLGTQTPTGFSFVCLSHGRSRRFVIWSHNRTRITPTYLSLQTRSTPHRHPKQSPSQKTNASAKDPWHMFKRQAAVVSSKQLTSAISRRTV